MTARALLENIYKLAVDFNEFDAEVYVSINGKEILIEKAKLVSVGSHSIILLETEENHDS